MKEHKIIRVGVIGAGEVAQFKIPKGTTDPYELMSLPDVDLVFNLTSDQYHSSLTIAVLQAGKHVMMEKPLTLSIKAGREMVEAEKAANGPRIFVGTMRRYAPSFTQAFKREISSIPRILYARSRGIIGPNSHFVPQSGAYNVRFNDISPAVAADFNSKMDALLEEAIGKYGMTTENIEYWRFLASLGSHDLSLMRETLGTPDSVAGVSVNSPFYSAIFNYKNKSGEPFSCTYETGIDAVPRFDSHLAVYGEHKTVTIQYDTPYIKGLPIKVIVDELVNGEAVRREILTSFEDAYTAEMIEMYACLVDGKEIKTTAEDSMEDLKLWTMMIKVHSENLEKLKTS